MNIYKLIGEYLSENTYLLEKEGKILVIDPGATAARIFDAAKNVKGEILAVLLTHGHADHALGAAELENSGVPVYLLGGEEEVLNGRANLSIALGFSLEKVKNPIPLKDGEILSLPPFEIQVIATPGHTAGGACYLIEGELFSGDTLFEFSYGRTDFPTGDEQDLLCSIANELFSLPDETSVYCGHSNINPGKELFSGVFEALPDTVIGREKTSNPILDLL